MKRFIVTFEIEEQSAKFRSMINMLINLSSDARLLKPGMAERIENAKQIRSFIPKWPWWHSRPWIIAGKLQGTVSEPVYEGPFIDDCRQNRLDKQVASLLECFDWAVFSYFTTYHSSYGFLVTADSAITKKTATKVYHQDIEISVFKDNPTASLRTASFYDYGLEGCLAYEVAKENGEKPPLLHCCVEEERGIDSRYEKNLKKLSPVEEFVVVEYQFGYRSRHMIYRVDDEQAYLDIWAEASEDHSIAEATFPANTDIQKLKSVLSRQRVLTIDKEVDAWCDWVYSQVYGGGSDEHHAIFRSKNPQITQKVWQWVGEDQISRF